MFWRVDVMRSTQKKNHQNPSTNKKSAAGGQNHPPPGKPPNLKDVNIPRVKNYCKKKYFVLNCLKQTLLNSKLCKQIAPQ